MREGEDAAGRIRESALRMLARREHAERELVRKLVSKGHDRDLSANVVAELKDANLVSDQRFVEALLHSRRERGFGPLKILSELRNRGVADELVQEYIDPTQSQWCELALKVHNKKFGSELPDSYREWARQARFLAQRGYTSEQIRTVLKSDASDSFNP